MLIVNDVLHVEIWIDIEHSEEIALCIKQCTTRPEIYLYLIINILFKIFLSNKTRLDCYAESLCAGTFPIKNFTFLIYPAC